jgi:YesN/AraC family two-component response regulator
MEWIEANPLPAVCQKCEEDFKKYQEATEAEKLLMKSYAISKISELLNFESPHYFCKVFKKITGETVSEYKKKMTAFSR